MVKLKWDWEIATILWKQKISISGTFAASYTKERLILYQIRKQEKDSLPENTERYKLMHQNKNTASVTHKLKITDGETYQDMEGKLEKCTHSLERGKEGLLGHREMRTNKEHTLARNIESRLIRI